MRTDLWKAALPIAMAAGLLLPASARGGAILSVPSVSANAGDVGDSFDVLLTYTGAPISVGGFAFEITTTDTDITFMDATTATLTPYIFAGTSLFGPDIVTSSPGQTLDASDISTAGGGVAVVAGSYGLGHVTFNVANPATAGPFVVTLTVDGSSLSDQNGDNIAVALSNGSITINGAAVPEPSSLAYVLSALCGLLAMRYRRGNRKLVRQ